MARRSARDWILLGLLVFMWGTAFGFTRVAVASVPATTLVAGRVAIAALVLRAALVLTRRRLPARGRIWLHFFAMASLGTALPFFLISWGQERIDSGLAGILMAVMPLTTLVLAHFFVAGERITGRRLSGFALGFLGIAVLLGPEALLELGGGASDLVRQGAVLGGAVCYAGNAVLARRLPATPPLVSSAAVMLLATALMIPAALWVDAPFDSAPRGDSLAAVVWLGLVATALATIVFFALIASAGPTFMSLINYLIPVVAVAAGVVALGEDPTLTAISGLLLILAGVATSQLESQASATRIPEGAEPGSPGRRILGPWRGRANPRGGRR